jgi:uncharacterized RDD family membrane protein YckC
MDSIDYTQTTSGIHLPVPIEQHRSGFGIRFAAYILDSVIVAIIAMLATLLIGIDFFSNTPIVAEQVQTLKDLASMLKIPVAELKKFFLVMSTFSTVATITTMAYSMLEALFAASPGKRVFGLQAATIEGSFATRQVLWKRWAFRNINVFISFFGLIHALSFFEDISSLFLLVFCIGCLFLLGSQRLTLHDRLSQTAVYPKRMLPLGNTHL